MLESITAKFASTT